jgi:large subunit ribosomal protein L24
MQTAKPLTKPTKQRKMLFQAPAHIRHKLLAAHLSAELRTSHGTKSFPVRTGDTVRVVRGDHKGVEGKITRVDLTKYRIYVEGLTREKVDGTTINVPVHPSKVIVTRLNLDDKWRKEILESKKEMQRRVKKVEKAEKIPKAKPPEEAVEIEKVKEEIKPVGERPIAKKKVPRKKVTRTKKPARKKAKEKAEPEAEEAPKETPEPKKQVKRTARKSTKKTDKGED